MESRNPAESSNAPADIQSNNISEGQDNSPLNQVKEKAESDDNWTVGFFNNVSDKLQHLIDTDDEVRSEIQNTPTPKT